MLHGGQNTNPVVLAARGGVHRSQLSNGQKGAAHTNPVEKETYNQAPGTTTEVGTLVFYSTTHAKK